MRKEGLSDRLFMIGGVFEKYRGTGGSFSAAEARFVADQLLACAELARAMAIEAGIADEMLNELVDEAREAALAHAAAAAARRSARPELQVIAGGLLETGWVP